MLLPILQSNILLPIKSQKVDGIHNNRSSNLVSKQSCAVLSKKNLPLLSKTYSFIRANIIAMVIILILIISANIYLGILLIYITVLILLK